MSAQHAKEDMLLHQNSAYMTESSDTTNLLLSDALDLHEPNLATEADGYVPIDPPIGLSRKISRKKTKIFPGLKSSSSFQSLSKLRESCESSPYEPVDIPEHILSPRTSSIVLQLVHQFESSRALHLGIAKK